MFKNKYIPVVDYVNLVNEIVDGFFLNGSYAPHFGSVNLRQIFYNKFYKDEYAPEIDTPESMDEVINEEFEKAFNLQAYGYVDAGLNFRKAVSDAKEIVDVRKTSIYMLADTLERIIGNAVSMISDKLTSEDFKKLESVISKFPIESFSEENLVQAYMDSKSDKQEK